MKNNLLFVVFLVVVVLILFIISGERSPHIPHDTVHQDLHTEQECLACHGEGMQNARKKTHPLKDQCFICHKRSKKNQNRR